jgi:hypothetical protein
MLRVRSLVRLVLLILCMVEGLGAAWAGMLAFDSLVFGMTLYKSVTLARTPGVDLLTILLRDGAHILQLLNCLRLKILNAMFSLSLSLV